MFLKHTYETASTVLNIQTYLLALHLVGPCFTSPYFYQNLNGNTETQFSNPLPANVTSFSIKFEGKMKQKRKMYFLLYSQPIGCFIIENVGAEFDKR